jgi:hypothetical protein
VYHDLESGGQLRLELGSIRAAIGLGLDLSWELTHELGLYRVGRAAQVRVGAGRDRNWIMIGSLSSRWDRDLDIGPGV